MHHRLKGSAGVCACQDERGDEGERVEQPGGGYTEADPVQHVHRHVGVYRGVVDGERTEPQTHRRVDGQKGPPSRPARPQKTADEQADDQERDRDAAKAVDFAEEVGKPGLRRDQEGIRGAPVAATRQRRRPRNIRREQEVRNEAEQDHRAGEGHDHPRRPIQAGARENEDQIPREEDHGRVRQDAQAEAELARAALEARQAEQETECAQQRPDPAPRPGPPPHQTGEDEADNRPGDKPGEANRVRERVRGERDSERERHTAQRQHAESKLAFAHGNVADPLRDQQRPQQVRAGIY